MLNCDRDGYIVDPVEGRVARVTGQANIAWGSRLARVTQLEAALRELFNARKPNDNITVREIKARDEASKLIAAIEQCRCGRCCQVEERCPCGACPTCCAEHCMPTPEGFSSCSHCGSREDRREDDGYEPARGAL